MKNSVAKWFIEGFCTLLVVMMVPFTGYSQSLGINATGGRPNASAGLDVDFPDKGLLIPRVALTNSSSASPLSAHVAGMMIYNTATSADVSPGFYYNNGSQWISGRPSGTTTGDICYWSGSAWVMVPIGSSGQFLQSNGSSPSWVAPQSIANFATLSTSEISSITGGTATTGGIITADGGSQIVKRGVCYSKTSNPTISGLSVAANPQTGLGTFYCNLSGLDPFTIYYVRAYATNGLVTAYGNEQSFTTLASTPTITTEAITDKTGTSATLSGNISYDGGAPVTARGFCWRLTPDYHTNFTNANNSTLNSGSGTGTFTSDLSGLTPGNAYQVRAYATNSAGTSYGNIQSFFAPGPPRKIYSGYVNSITDGGAGFWDADIMAVEVWWDGGSPLTGRGICWNTSKDPTVDNNFISKTSGDNYKITGLISGTTYYVRAYATNDNGTSYGNEIPVTPGIPCKPTVTTRSIMNKIGAIAEGTSYIASQGGSPVTHSGLCWGTTANPDIDSHLGMTDVGIMCGSSVYSAMTGLEIGTTYHVRAYATNSEGTAYGDEVVFTETAATIGQEVGGGNIIGKVFFVDETGLHGLIAADPGIDDLTDWGCPNTSAGATGTAIGTGLANTTKILEDIASHGCTSAFVSEGGNFAAQMNDYSKDYKYLPSKDELSLMWTNRVAAGLDAAFTAAGPIWSSSEVNSTPSTPVWYFDPVSFYNGNIWFNTGVKSDKKTTWLIRSF